MLSLITSWVGLNNSIAECIIYISNITRISVEVSPEIASVDFFVSAIFDLKSLLLSLLIFTLFALLNVLFPLAVVVFLITYRIIQSSELALEDIFRLSKGQAYIYLTITSGYKVARKMQTKCKLWIAHAIVIANYHTLLFLTNTTLLTSHNQGEKQVSGKLLGKNFLLRGRGSPPFWKYYKTLRKHYLVSPLSHMSNLYFKTPTDTGAFWIFTIYHKRNYFWICKK